MRGWWQAFLAVSPQTEAQMTTARVPHRPFFAGTLLVLLSGVATVVRAQNPGTITASSVEATGPQTVVFASGSVRSATSQDSDFQQDGMLGVEFRWPSVVVGTWVTAVSSGSVVDEDYLDALVEASGSGGKNGGINFSLLGRVRDHQYMGFGVTGYGSVSQPQWEVKNSIRGLSPDTVTLTEVAAAVLLNGGIYQNNGADRVLARVGFGVGVRGFNKDKSWVEEATGDPGDGWYPGAEGELRISVNNIEGAVAGYAYPGIRDRPFVTFAITVKADAWHLAGARD